MQLHSISGLQCSDNEDFQWELVRSVRYRVFVEEQGIPKELEWDNLDTKPNVTHFWLTDDENEICAVARVIREEVMRYRIGRFAVLSEYRGRGVGKTFLQMLEDSIIEEIVHDERCKSEERSVAEPHAGIVCKTFPMVRIVLSAQVQAVGFYKKCGYALVSEKSHIEAGIEHYEMGTIIS